MELMDLCIEQSCVGLLVAVASAYADGEQTAENLFLVCDRKAVEAESALQQAFAKHALAESLQEMFMQQLQVPRSPLDSH